MVKPEDQGEDRVLSKTPQPECEPENAPGKNEEEGKNLAKDQQGATMLEWTLLLAAIALPSYLIIKLALSALAGQYRMLTTLNGLPFP